MKNKIVKKIGQFFGILIVLGIPVFVYFMIKLLLDFFSRLEQTNQVTFISILFSGLIGLIIYLIQKYYEKQKDIDIELIKKKSDSLNEIIKLWFDYNFLKNLETDEKKRASKENELLMKLFDTSQKNLFLWASEETLVFYSRMRRRMASDMYKDNPYGLMKEYGTFMKLIRKELGHKDKKLKISDIFGLYTNDIDQHAHLIDN